MKNEQMNLEMLYTEIAAASSVDFSDKIHVPTPTEHWRK